MAEDIKDTNSSNPTPGKEISIVCRHAFDPDLSAAWDDLCPLYYGHEPSQFWALFLLNGRFVESPFHFRYFVLSDLVLIFPRCFYCHSSAHIWIKVLDYKFKIIFSLAGIRIHLSFLIRPWFVISIYPLLQADRVQASMPISIRKASQTQSSHIILWLHRFASSLSYILVGRFISPLWT